MALKKIVETVLMISFVAVCQVTGCAKRPTESETQPYDVEPTIGNADYATIKVFFATDRNRSDSTQPSKMFGSDRSAITYGTCDVSIPRDHRVGVLESPSFLKFEYRGDPERHVLLLSVYVEDQKKYFASIGARLKESSKKNAFVFIHGYNVTFEDAARRTAQMAYDLGFDGAPVFYSWPSQGSLSGYTVDETNNEWSQNNLKQFLDDFASQTNAQDIFLIAHSMGSRALTRAFGQLIRERPLLRSRFREVILSAPDIDADVFKRDIASQIIPATLYASSRDEALRLSKTFHGYPRAGDAGLGIVIVPGIE
jgi:esterase/lipase superfamily enzyme